MVVQGVEELAKFPEENPNPVLRINTDGVILYANQGSRALLEDWQCAVGDTAPQRIFDNVAGANTHNENRAVEVDCCGDRLMRLEIAPVAGQNYVNVYGKDVTQMRRIERALANHNDSLRGPLTRLLGASDSLVESAGGNKQLLSDIESVREAGCEILSLLDEVSKRI